MASKSAQEVARFVFQKHYKDLSSGIQVHLHMIAVNLYSNGLILVDTRDKTLDNSSTPLEKSMCVLKDVEERMKRDSSVFEKFCEVLCSPDVGLSDLGEPMLCDYQQLCPNPAAYGSHHTLNETSSKFTEPAAESQADVTDEGSPILHPSRSDGFSVGECGGEKAESYTMPFKATQDAGNDSYTYNGGSEQVVPQKESGFPGTTDSYASLFHFDAKYSTRDRDNEEDRLISDLILSWDKVKLKFENCASARADYETKLQRVMEFYDKRSKTNVMRYGSFRQLEKEKQHLEKEKQHLLGTIDIQSKDRKRLEGQLEEMEEEIEVLQRQIKQQKLELSEKQMHLEKKQREHERLKSSLSSKERKLYEITQSANNCPVYSNPKRRAHFERKKVLCEIQSLVAKFFSTYNVDDKSKLLSEIQSKFAHVTLLKRHRSSSF